MKKFLVILVLFAAHFAHGGSRKDGFHTRKNGFSKKANTAHENIDYWKNVAKSELNDALESITNINTNVAKNVIIFVGDGMSLTTQTAARIYRAQHEGKLKGKPVNGEESLLTFEKFPHLALSKTYCVDCQTSDSASTASAMFSGVKTNYYTIGFDNTIVNEDPYSEHNATKVETIMKWAQDQGKDTGFVTTARVSHATPAGLYAHTADRGWECDQDLPSDRPSDVHDITWQLVRQDPGRRMKVVMGGGRSSFLPLKPDNSTKTRWDYEDDDWECRREDQLNLMQEFLNKSALVPGFQDTTGVEVENVQQLRNVSVENIDYILGLFAWTYMDYEYEREQQDPDSDKAQPSLTEMTEVAIKVLQKNQEQGFVLMVEGGLIDHAHHSDKAKKALHDTMAFDKAIEKAMEMTDEADTLIIVTADHSHTMSMGGYQSRGVDVTGLVDNEDGEDGKPYAILNYANGKGFYNNLHVENGHVSRLDLGKIDGNYTQFEFRMPAAVPKSSETHSATDVAIFARGPYSHLFHTVHEQSYIGHVMAFSACMGPYKNELHCRNK